MAKKVFFGKTKNNEDVYSYILDNGKLKVEILNYGATIKNIIYKDTDVVLGYDSITEYEENGGYFGATVGRFANRIKNARFVLNGIEYKLAANDGDNHIHGGVCGFDKKIWQVECFENKLVMNYLSPDMEEGYPGNLKVEVVFEITDTTLSITYNAISDKDTIVNLTNHSYFNLNGAGEGNILSHRLIMNCDNYTPIDENVLVTGEVKPVKDTVYDFTSGKEVGKDFENEEIMSFGGYDHNFCKKDDSKPIAVLEGDKITMEVTTTLPGVQLYTGNFIDGLKGKNNKIYNKNAALCLETQTYPNSINEPDFPSPAIKAKEKFESRTTFKFI